MSARALPPDGNAFVLWYPKAGRTWLRAMIGKVLVDRYGFPESEMLDADKLKRRVHLPAVDFGHGGSAFRGLYVDVAIAERGCEFTRPPAVA